jgi:uncharacterized FlgJ-related protein
MKIAEAYQSIASIKKPSSSVLAENRFKKLKSGSQHDNQHDKSLQAIVKSNQTNSDLQS